jgi:hypothetical protein
MTIFFNPSFLFSVASQRQDKTAEKLFEKSVSETDERRTNECFTILSHYKDG